MTEPGDPQPDMSAQEPSTRPAWLIPALAVGLVVIIGIVIALVVANNDSDDTNTDEETAIVVDASPAEIRVLQQDLTSLGYYSGPINGVYNQKTVDAVKQLQTELGITADGIVGPETLAAIDEQLGGTSPTPEATTPPEETPEATEPPVEEPEVKLTVDGGSPETFVVTKCDNPGETDLKLEAQTEEDENPVKLELDAEGGTGTIELSGGNEAEGTVDELMVGDTGEITASGELTPSDDDAETVSYELVGACA